MQRVGALFLLGLATLLPAMLIGYLLFRFLAGAERMLGQVLATLLPANWYLPGMGLLAGLLLILMAGLLARSWIGPPVGRWLSHRVGRLPILGRLYLALRAVIRRFSGEHPVAFTSVVLVLDGAGGRGRIGLVAERQPMQLSPEGPARVPVYFPAPFQPGGDLEFVPADHLQEVEMSVDQALTLVLSAGLARESGP
ncbi:DUF502 domain-containing protein [Natronospira sp.]|uniref:DUF502 domain-containing protein n=1 Tax=Natronospira sp. TaxID=2024970 RepID=UPI00387384A8